MKIATTLEYDGAAYSGFQRQKAHNSVQAELEKALRTVLRRETRIWCAGRTDTGVNALGQVVHFSVENPQDLPRLIYSLNSLLPRDIAIRHAAVVPENFHARFSCLAREYVYSIDNSPYRPSTLGYKSLWLREKLEWDCARAAIPHLLGEQNFAAFTRAALVKSGEKTHRRIDAIHIVEEGNLVFVHFRGSGFLHNMIRILTGTLLDIARKKIKPEKLASILASADRLEAGVTLKPDALYFLYAEYAEYDQSAHWNSLRTRLLAAHASAARFAL